jgi:hypothetical protein
MPASAAKDGVAVGPPSPGNLKVGSVSVGSVSPTATHVSGWFDCYGSSPKCVESGARCTSTISGGLQTALNSAVGGKVICLKSGSYGAISIRSKAYSSDVIVQPVAGATATIGDITLTSVKHLRFSGAGGTLKAARTLISGPNTTFDTLDHIVFTACVRFNGTTSSNNLLVNHDRLDNLGIDQPGCDMGEGRIQVEDGDAVGMRKGWLRIANSHFGGEGKVDCSDGVQLGGDGVTVGPGNEFTGIYQGHCSAHADPVQIVGGSNETITGNYFHDNGDGSGGCMCHDFNPDNETITNNVFASKGYSYSILAGDGARNWLIAHNVFYEDVSMDDGHSSPNGSGNVLRDNVFIPGAVVTDAGSGVSYDHNLNCVRRGAGCPGTRNLKGRPIFVGGTKPTTYQGYGLARGSPGKGAASDGSDLGIRTSTSACKRGSVAALVGGKRVCLKAGNRCNIRYDRQYRQHGFRCVKGRLRKLPRHGR